MRCPYCAHEDSKVTDSRAAENGIRRRRECLSCNRRFTTYERVQSAAVQVVKRDERREEFNREKLAASIRKASGKRPLPVNAIDKLTADVEAEVQHLGRAEISSSLIGEMVMDRLKALDRVAYIRFASVYRDFADIDNFRDEIESLMAARESRSTSAQLPLLPGEKPMPRAARRRPRRPRGARMLAADEARAFGFSPKVALLSRSNFGTCDSVYSRRAARAVELLHARAPELEVDGEMHGDAALSESIRKAVLPGTRLRGQANVLVMPNVEAAHIAYNMLKVLGGGITIGPILLGAARSAHVVTQSITVRGLVNMSALACARAKAGAPGHAPFVAPVDAS